MVRSLVAFGVSALVSLMPAWPASAVEMEEAGSPVEADSTGLSTAHMPRRLETPAQRLTSCDLCAGVTCTTVRVRGRCTLDKAVDALRRGQIPFGQSTPKRLRHRDRSVSGADYKPLVLEEFPEAGRARARPRRDPQGSGATASRLLEIYENSNRSLSVRESGGPQLKARSFRPLDLSPEAADEQGEGDEEDEGPH